MSQNKQEGVSPFTGRVNNTYETTKHIVNFLITSDGFSKLLGQALFIFLPNRMFFLGPVIWCPNWFSHEQPH